MPSVDHPIIGARFDIRKASSGSYGMEFWKIIWSILDPKDLYSILFYEGDTYQTLQGNEEVYCIAFQSADSSQIQKIRAALMASETFRNVAANPMFVEGPECAQEPLESDGRINFGGVFSQDSFNSRVSLAKLHGLEPQVLLDPEWRDKPPFKPLAWAKEKLKGFPAIDALAENEPEIPKEHGTNKNYTEEELIQLDSFEVRMPSGAGKCSDDDCPCPPPGTHIPRGGGFLYIDASLIEYRRQARTEENMKKIGMNFQGTSQGGGYTLFLDQVSHKAILMCLVGAKKRQLDLRIASEDAQLAWAENRAPLRATPKKESEGGCFIATACYDFPDHPDIDSLRIFRDQVLKKQWGGKHFVEFYYKYSPSIARKIEKAPSFFNIFIKNLLVRPLAKIARVATEQKITDQGDL